MVRDQIERSDSLRPHILNNHVQQLTGNTLTAVFFFGINGTNIGRQVLSVVEVVLDNTHTTDDAGVVKTEIPAIFRFVVQICLYTFEICLFGHIPFAMKPCCRRILQVRSIP